MDYTHSIRNKNNASKEGDVREKGTGECQCENKNLISSLETEKQLHHKKTNDTLQL
jgi:hypothetical protein